MGSMKRLLCHTGAYGPFILTGRENRRRRYRAIKLKSSPVYQIVAIEDGSVTFRCNGETLGAIAPCVLLFQPDLAFGMTLPLSGTWHFVKFHAVYQPRKPVGRTEADAPGITFFHNSTRSQPGASAVWGVDLPLTLPAELVADAITRIRWCNAHWWLDASNYARANHQLGLWLLDIVETVKTGRSIETDWFSRVRQHCIDSVVHGLSVRELAAAFGMSRQQLYNRLVDECGQSPKAFIDSIRIEIACRRLRTTKNSVENIARYCGYSCLATFIRSFKKHTGTTPRKWREENHVPGFL